MFPVLFVRALIVAFSSIVTVPTTATYITKGLVSHQKE
jgi:hypothetical protein